MVRHVPTYGRCALTNIELTSDDWDCHHIIPMEFGGTDRYENLIVLHRSIHQFVHLTDKRKIECVLEAFQLSKREIEKVNELRIKARNIVIK